MRVGGWLPVRVWPFFVARHMTTTETPTPVACDELGEKRGIVGRGGVRLELVEGGGG